MNKVKKIALKTGAYKDNKYYYCCSDCGKQNELCSKRCVCCNAKRPAYAFEQATAMQKPKQEEINYGFVDRTVRNAYPTPANPSFAVPLPGNGYDPDNYVSKSLNNLPTYYSTDEYGRIFETQVSYGALPCSAPVPVPIPSRAVELAPINVSLNRPNNTNN